MYNLFVRNQILFLSLSFLFSICVVASYITRTYLGSTSIYYVLCFVLSKNCRFNADTFTNKSSNILKSLNINTFLWDFHKALYSLWGISYIMWVVISYYSRYGNYTSFCWNCRYLEVINGDLRKVISHRVLTDGKKDISRVKY